MHVRTIRTVAVLVACALGTARAEDQEPGAQRPAGGRVHGQWFLHLEAGASWLRTGSDETERYTATTLSGPGPSLAVSGGTSIGGRLALGAEAWAVLVPRADVDGDGGSGGVDRASLLTLTGLGPTLRISLDPGGTSLFVSATPSFTWLAARADGRGGAAGLGFGGRLALGKEWPLPRARCRLGLAAQLVLASNRERGDAAPTWTTAGGGLGLSVTWE